MGRGRSANKKAVSPVPLSNIPTAGLEVH